MWKFDGEIMSSETRVLVFVCVSVCELYLL